MRYRALHRASPDGRGRRCDRVEFTPEALDLLYNASNGNPRLINLIADKSLHRGHLDRTWTITPAIVTAALEDLGYATRADHRRKRAGREASCPPRRESVFAGARSSRHALPERPLPDMTDEGPHFLLEEVARRCGSDAPQAPRTPARASSPRCSQRRLLGWPQPAWR